MSFTPGALRVQNVSGRWKITEGSHWVADFGSNRAAADQGLAIIQRYGFTSQCFVARPNPQMTYWRRGERVPNLPTGAGEDCIAVNPANVQARNVGGAWKVVQGNQWMLDLVRTAKARTSCARYPSAQSEPAVLVSRPMRR
ncbi:MAG: hypothetical protein IPG56_11695 [Caulobacteraceae bacterium]|nr:hypothetical protein [Caulobacteraceae bacterium]